MPTGNLRECSYPGCRVLVEGGRCIHHRYIGKPRPKTAERGYDAAWRRKRARFLRTHRYCQIRVKCKGAPSTEVDHIEPLSQGGADDDSNYQAACHRCHSWKTATEDTGRYRGRFDAREN